MAYKQNTLKVLVCLYAVERAQQSGLTLLQSQELLSGLTATGCRSLLILLEKKKLIFRKRLLGTTTYVISEQGVKALKDSFPSLNQQWEQWDGKWMAVSFLAALKTDKQFRYLRQLLVSDGGLPLGRGFYVKANGFSSRVLQQLSDLYQGAVTVFWVGEWIQGFDRPLIFSYYDLNDIATSLSGISGDVSRLLSISSIEKRLNKKQKNNLYIAVDRLVSCLRENPGFLRYYFPEAPDTTTLLVNIGKLLQL